ncbi:CFEM domain-containing protein [Sarocladium implicatum]|nr:CFEM domain-containing protein [Sarocladium implicatum]
MSTLGSIGARALHLRQDAPPEMPVFSDDYEYPYSALQHGGFVILFTFPALALITVLLRVYTRLSTKQFGLDDAFISLAMLDSLAETGVSYMGMRKAFLGVHNADIPPEADLGEGMRWNYIIQALYNPILALVKTSVLLFLLRLSGQNKRIRMAIHALNAFNIALMIAIFLVVIFQCTPIDYFWKQFRPGVEGHCINSPIFVSSTAALNVLTDILVLALPFWIFLGLQMPRKVKWALLGVFALGGIVTVISILRLAWLVEISFYPPGPDSNYDIRFTYSAVETNLAIIAASAPALRGLFVKWFPRFFSSLTSGGRPAYGESGYSGKQSRSGTNGLNSQHHMGSRHTDTFQMKNMKNRSEIRSHSPTASEEEIMTYNGIIRTREVDVMYSDGSSENHGAADKDHFGEPPSHGDRRLQGV